jgi:aminopeptidase N
VIDLAVASLPVEDTEDTPRRTAAWLFRDVVPLAPHGSLARLHDAAIAKVGATEVGSEQQLAAFRAAIRSAEDDAVLRGWLAATPEGIELDLDLRWRILSRLAALGAVSRAELQEAYDAEPANDARVALTGALCSLPDAEAQTYAWSIFTGETDLPNYDVVAAGQGLWRGPEELTAPYVERYFQDLPQTVQKRSGWVLATAAEAFFPADAVSEETLALADGLLADQGLDLTLRRVVVDAADQLRRQLAIKEKWPR